MFSIPRRDKTLSSFYNIYNLLQYLNFAIFLLILVHFSNDRWQPFTIFKLSNFSLFFQTINGNPSLTALVTSLRQEQLDAETVVKAENVANGNGVANTNGNADEDNGNAVNGNQQQLNNGNNLPLPTGNGLSPPPISNGGKTGNLKSKSDLLLSLSCRDTLSNGGGGGNIIESTTTNNRDLLHYLTLFISYQSTLHYKKYGNRTFNDLIKTNVI